MIQYKTVIGTADKIDPDINHLAKEGWIVQSTLVVGDVEYEDEEHLTRYMPILSYLMVKDVPEELANNGRPERKVLGRAQ